MKFYKICFVVFCLLCFTFSSKLKSKLKDPFKDLGIPSINPSNIFNNDFLPTSFNKVTNAITPSTIKGIEDLPKYLQNFKIPREEGIKIISRYLIADDYIMKKNGGIFDASGRDGLTQNEPLAPYGTVERKLQKARSAAKLYDISRFNDLGYDAYGAERCNDDKYKNLEGWEIYKVLLMGKNGIKDHIFFKVCLPLDDYYTPIVVKFNEECINSVRIY